MNGFKNIISLGFNCEVSFRIEDYLGEQINSYPLSWAFLQSREGFIEFLDNPDDLLNGEIKMLPNGMVLDLDYLICFHGKSTYSELMSEDGTIREDVMKDTIDELKSRVGYLLKKWDFMLSQVEKYLFILKVDGRRGDDDVRYVEQVYSILDKKVAGTFVMLVVLENIYFTKHWDCIQHSNILVRGIEKFAPINDTKLGGDIEGWLKIIEEAKNVLTVLPEGGLIT